MFFTTTLLLTFTGVFYIEYTRKSKFGYTLLILAVVTAVCGLKVMISDYKPKSSDYVIEELKKGK